MVAEKRTPLPQKPGVPERYDYEYERKGMLNIFAFFEPKRGWRHLDVSDVRDLRRWISPKSCGGWWRSTIPRPRRCGWSSRQPKHPHSGLVLQGVRSGGSQAPLAPAGVPPHSRPRLVAEHGRDRALGAFAAVLGASHPRYREAWEGDRGMGTEAQRRRGDGAMALHGVRRSGEAGTPLPGTTIVVEY